MNLVKAETFAARYIGLLGKRSLPMNSALYIPHCKRAHTWFMRFAIDIVFLDEEGIILKIFLNVRPWHSTDKVPQADGCLEMAAGEAWTRGIRVGKKCIIDSY